MYYFLLGVAIKEFISVKLCVKWNSDVYAAPVSDEPPMPFLLGKWAWVDAHVQADTWPLEQDLSLLIHAPSALRQIR